MLTKLKTAIFLTCSTFIATVTHAREATEPIPITEDCFEISQIKGNDRRSSYKSDFDSLLTNYKEGMRL